MEVVRLTMAAINGCSAIEMRRHGGGWVTLSSSISLLLFVSVFSGALSILILDDGGGDGAQWCERDDGKGETVAGQGWLWCGSAAVVIAAVFLSSPSYIFYAIEV
ncbi:hypothetical protein SESBI_44606 [Sesbania bispinosa]|nr:hypothetical protein SESBI_44606 [Sesbania bispinosa]